VNANDRTKCDPIRAVLNTGNFCPDNSFSNGATCELCSSQCLQCRGPGDGDCLTCAQGLFMLNGRCVPVDGNGICSGSNGLVADNVKKVCESESSSNTNRIVYF